MDPSVAPREPPELLAFAHDAGIYRVVLRTGSAVRVLEVARAGGAVVETGAVTVTSPRCVAAVGPGAWIVGAAEGGELLVWHAPRGERPRVEMPGGVKSRGKKSRVEMPHTESAGGVASAREPDPTLAAFVHDGAPCVGAFGGSLKLRVVARQVGGELAGLLPSWSVPDSARALCALTANVYGPAGVFATDRDDEVDVCVGGPGGDAQVRTLSLGREQRFECAAGGGTKLLVVSRGRDGLAARTLAGDARSELNAVPIAPATGYRVGAVRCAYANGPFVVAHAEHAGDESAVVLTRFDDGATVSVRLAMPTVDALAVEGKDLAVVALRAGAGAAHLVVQRITVAGTGRRGYAYLLDAPSHESSAARRAALADVAAAVATSLGYPAPRDFAVHTEDARADVATFRVPGLDGDRSFGLLLRADGSGVATVRLGSDPVAPRGLGFVASLRQVFTGDDDGDPRTTRLESRALWTSVSAIVSAAGALGLVGGPARS